MNGQVTLTRNHSMPPKLGLNHILMDPTRSCIDLYEEAHDAHYRDREYERALDLYKSIIKEFPGSAEARYARTQIENIAQSGQGMMLDPGPLPDINSNDTLGSMEQRIGDRLLGWSPALEFALFAAALFVLHQLPTWPNLLVSICSALFFLGASSDPLVSVPRSKHGPSRNTP